MRTASIFASHSARFLRSGLLAVLVSAVGAVSSSGAFNPINSYLVSDFTVFAEGNMTMGGHVHGATAIGGDLTLTSGNVEFGHERPGLYKVNPNDAHYTTLVIGGRFNTLSGGSAKLQNNGWMTLGNIAGTHLWDTNRSNETSSKWGTTNPIKFQITATGAAYNSSPSITSNIEQAADYITRNPGIDFAQQFSELRQSATLVASLAPSIATRANAYTWSNNYTELTVNLASGYTLVDLTASQFAGLSKVTINGTLSATSGLVFDVSGSVVNFGNWNLQDKGEGASKFVLFNLAEATSVSLGSQLIYGSVLAPNAAVTRPNNSQNFSGQIIAASYSQIGTSEIHYYPLEIQVPEPATVGLILGLGAGGIVLFRRRLMVDRRHSLAKRCAV